MTPASEHGPNAELEELLNEVTQILESNRALGEMRQIDQEVGQVLTDSEYRNYLRYKKYCLEELAALNKTEGCNGALMSAIERGFILGYWLGFQHKA